MWLDLRGTSVDVCGLGVRKIDLIWAMRVLNDGTWCASLFETVPTAQWRGSRGEDGVVLISAYLHIPLTTSRAIANDAMLLWNVLQIPFSQETSTELVLLKPSVVHDDKCDDVVCAGYLPTTHTEPDTGKNEANSLIYHPFGTISPPISIFVEIDRIGMCLADVSRHSCVPPSWIDIA
jgi:hypothetical protein